MRALQPRCEARVSSFHGRAQRFTRRCSAAQRASAVGRSDLLRGCSAAAFDVSVLADSADAAVERACLAWLDSFVIGMELCPFARSARRGTRVAVCRAETADHALDALWPEVRRLAAAPLDAPATTLFALPGAFVADFDDYMALHERAEREARSITEAIQLVPFHPEASYSETERDAAEYATRSPLPIIHLLRCSDIRRAEAEWEGGDIPSANADRLRGMGAAALAGMLARFRRMTMGDEPQS